MRKAYNRINMIGKTYNSWTVIEFIETINKISFYSARCGECSNVFRVDGRNLRSGASKRCVECGLKHTKQANIGRIKAKSTPEKMTLNYLFNTKKKDAIKRGKGWSLTKTEFKKLIFNNCTYCGIKPSTTTNVLKNHDLHTHWIENGNITYNGIDRVDSRKSYITDNVVTCCKQCNTAKSDYTLEEFKTWIERVYKHLNSQNG